MKKNASCTSNRSNDYKSKIVLISSKFLVEVDFVHLRLFFIEVNFQRIFKYEMDYVSMCKYNNYKFSDLTFF